MAVAIVLALLSACSHSEPPPREMPRQDPVAVQVETIRATAQSVGFEAVGTVRAETSAQISSRIPAYIRQIHVEAGDRVARGQLLVELDDRDLVVRLDEAKAAQAEAEDAIQEAAQGLAAAQAQLTLAETTHKRFEDLLAKKSVSQHEYDEVDARVRAARAVVEMAQSRKRQAEARRERAEALMGGAEVSAGYAQIEAPFDGVVVERRLDPGTQAAPGMPILVIDQAGEFRLDAIVPETRLSSVRAGETVEIRLESIEGPLNGRVREIVPAVDSNSRTAVVKITLPATRGLRSGMFGRAVLAAAPGEPALTVPEQAIIRHGQLQSVYVAEDGVARRRLVTLGGEENGRRTVLSGLSGGEQVVLNPEGVRDGGPVRVSATGARS